MLLAVAFLAAGRLDPGKRTELQAQPMTESSLRDLAEAQAVLAQVIKQEPWLHALATRFPSGPHIGGRAPGTLPTACSTTRVLLTAALTALVANDTSIPGDIVETGTYVGGTAITMLSMLQKFDSPKRLFACDSFAGLPDRAVGDTSEQEACKRALGKSRAACAAGRTGTYKTSEEIFLNNVARYRVDVDRRLHVVKGWFNESLPELVAAKTVTQIAFLRLDGDMYASTLDALSALYPLLSEGGVVYADDYGTFGGCSAAIHDYRRAQGITAPMHRIVEESGSFERISGRPMDTTLKRKYEGKTEGVWWVKRPGACFLPECFVGEPQVPEVLEG